ncbi:MAG: 3-phosphoshikimate 1-carboxyvinyltransferase [Synechococcus sp. SB0668_bin_15]|nr:3-phosphoshikimate 1-carboxyvinyltransferase [Synechococcus sp. SB0668_bin_15]MXZ83635.1 3-phosphoshikimate 1-carboxyvinyltransferase [Synechococcus sp. SB0666_bin_14]MYC49753.1 3-phosphoshikimate 1-carboxyvinyltransferase [Synechococcus sp. SB0662_bin_14]MYG46715.1 3-phosphoshikimate 1-carboxyvinyltransferase [Synechococcus sp. SB0675_bin_6]MYJ59371.1 3-phosphoshikimate 1-carboxyvinyltransferase [Synechococcus sp. SB0672_bin_6]MYK90592.1 3-phosphoshikimate 1-carboxyvinyltransferase [Synech
MSAPLQIEGNSITIEPGHSLQGEVRVPGDKSISHRALLFGAVAEGVTTIHGMLAAEDPCRTAECLRAMGVAISPIGDKDQPVAVEGVGLDGLQEPGDILDCGNSGTTMRLLLGLLAGRRGRYFVLTGDGSLRRRPMGRVSRPLCHAMGARIDGRANGTLAPLTVSGCQLQGGVIGTSVASAQVKSALLLAGLTASSEVSVIEPNCSRDHSERMLKAFGANVQVSGDYGRHVRITPGQSLRGQAVHVPGDISSAAFWLVGAAITPGSRLRLHHVGLNPTRIGALEVLRAMGAQLRVENQTQITGEPVGDLVIEHGPLGPFSIDADLVPRLVDEIPVLAVAALFAEGTSRIQGARELRVKETDRLAVMTRQLRAMGAVVEETADGLVIDGPQRLRGARLDSETDHRVAMSLAMAALNAHGPSQIQGIDAADVSYPGFWQQLGQLRMPGAQES